jgi:hypothetical protein
MVCNLKATRPSRWIVVDVEIRALIEPVKQRARTGTLEIVVDIREAVACQRLASGWHLESPTRSVSALRQEEEA